MEKFIHEFGIDWKLLIAQLVNFAVVLFVLGKFVYKPVIKLLDQRRKKIEEGIAFSEKAKTEFDQIEVLKANELKKAERESLEIIKKGEASGNKVRDEILKHAEVEKEKVLLAGKNALFEERSKLEKNFYAEAAGVVSEAVMQVLKKGSFAKDEEKLINEAVKEIKV